MANQIVTPKTGLTDSFLKSLKPQLIRVELSDNKSQGLRIRLAPTGRISFVWYYRCKHTSKNKVLTLGKYGDESDCMTLKQARDALEIAKAKHEAGELGSTSRKVPVTVSDLCEEFYNVRILPHLRRPEAVKICLDNDIVPSMGNSKLIALRVGSLNKCIDAVVRRGSPVQAGHVLATLKQLFKFAEGRGYIDHSPAYALEPKMFGIPKNEGRERYLELSEIKLVWDAIDSPTKMSLPVRYALKALLLTGVRTGELMKAEWAHIDFDKKEWFIPKENTKTLEEWTVPLTQMVIDLLKKLQGIDDKYVFAGQKGALTDKVLGRALRRLFESEVLTIERCTPHDFRRTVRTHLERLGVEPHICEKCLNHSLGAINKIYNKNAYIDQRREALEKWASCVDLLVNDRDNVVLLRAVL